MNFSGFDVADDACGEIGWLNQFGRVLHVDRRHPSFNRRGNDRIVALSAKFYMSPNYVSIYVRKHTGLSVKQMIMQTKLKAAEQLLAHGKMNVNEIAAKLGFTDASHFNKLFKKYKFVNPSNIKKLSGFYSH